jgi:Ca2+-binding EF-hand superfamily protein
MPTYRTMKQGLFREGQKTGLGLGGSGRVEILRCVKGLKTGMAEWYVKFIDLKLENKYQSDLIIYITKRKIVHKKQKDIENKDFTFHIDIGVGGCAKGPAVKGTFIQPIYNVPLERDITGLYIAKPGEEKPLTADTQIHLWCQVLNKSDRDPAEWYPILHQHRKSLEDMFFQRKNATRKKKDDGSTSITDDNISTDQKLRLLKNNASKAFDRFDADNSGSVDLGEYNKMLRYLELFLLPCDSKRIFYNCDMDDTGELDQDQFEVALYVIMTIQEYQSKAAKMAKDAASKSGAIEDNDDRDENTSMRLEPHEAFESFDNDQDGLLDQLEFNEALRCLGVIESAPKDPLTQEEDLKRLMDQLLEEIPSGLDTQEDETMNDPTRLITFVQFLHGWVTCCNISYEIKCRNVIIQQPKHGLPMKPKDALLKHVASAARRQSELMAHARSQGWEMKRLARIEIERKRRAIEKQSEKENSKARKELALQEKEDRIAAKAARMQKFEAERRLSTYKNNSKMAQKKRVEEELDEKKIILMNRIKEKDLLASRMGWDVIDYSDSKLLDIPSDIYWWKVGKKSKDEDSKDLSSVLLFDLSNNRLEEWPKNEFFFRADKIQVMKLDYNLLTTLPSGLSDCRDLVYLSISQNKLNGNSILGKETPLTHLKKLIYLDLSGNEIEEWPFQNSFQNIPTLEILKLNNNNLNMIPGPECLSSFLKLKTLDLSNNDIIALGSDHGIGLLTSLEVLNLSSNILESLPEDLGCIGSHLLTLNLSNNNLRWLPNTIE